MGPYDELNDGMWPMEKLVTCCWVVSAGAVYVWLRGCAIVGFVELVICAKTSFVSLGGAMLVLNSSASCNA